MGPMAPDYFIYPGLDVATPISLENMFLGRGWFCLHRGGGASGVSDSLFA